MKSERTIMDTSHYLRPGRHLSRHSQTLRLLTKHRQKTMSNTTTAETPPTPHLGPTRPSIIDPFTCEITELIATSNGDIQAWVIFDTIHRQR